MQRYIRGLMLAGTAVVAWGCTDNPIGDGADDPAQIVASPSSIFADAGETVTMTVEVQNDQGAALASQFSILNVDAGITAVIDSTFNPYYDADGNLVPPTSPTRIRVLVTAGAQAGVFNFDVAAAGLTSEMDVRVLPLDITGTFSNAAPACNAPVTYTVADPYVFSSTSVVTAAGALPPITQSVAGDGSSITFLPAPGFDGTVTISDVELSFLPGAPVNLTTLETVTAGTTGCGFTGQDDVLTSAPAIDAPALGGVTGVFDQGDIAVDQYYILNVTQNGNYEVSMNWDNTSDVDLYLLEADGVTEVCHSWYDQPEACSADLVPGTYVVQMQLFSGAVPGFISISVSNSGGS